MRARLCARRPGGEIHGVRIPFAAASSRSSSSTSRHRPHRRRNQRRPCGRRGIFGGKDLSAEFPELGQSALYCVTEIHSAADIDRLADAMQEAVA